MSVTPNEVQNITDQSAPLATTNAGLSALTDGFDSGVARVPGPQVPMNANPSPGAAPTIDASQPGFSERFGNELTGVLSDPRAAAALNQPGGFAKMVLASSTRAMAAGSFAQKLSSALGNIGADASHASDNLQPGQGALKGALNTLAAGAQREAGAKQQQFENQRKMNAEQMEEQKTKAVIAESNARQLHSEKLTHQLDETAINESITNGKMAVEKFKNAPSPAPVVQDGITSAEMQTMVAQNKIDPTTQTAYPTGRKQVGEDANGLPKYATTYTVIGVPNSVTVSAEDAPFLSKYSGLDVKPGQVLPGAQYNNLYQSASDNQAATQARNKSLVDAKIADAKQAQQLETVTLGPGWTNALANNNNDPVAALAAMQKDPQMRKQYPNLATDVMNLYGGPKNWDDMVDHQTERRIQQQEANTKASEAAFKKQQANGLTIITSDKTGNDYLNSLPPADKAVVQGVIEGRLTLSPRQLQDPKGQKVVAQVMQAYPDFDISKAPGYAAARKDFTSGKTAVALNAYGTAMTHLKELYDVSGPQSFVPGTAEHTKFQNTITLYSPEIAKALNGGTAPTEKEIEAVKGSLSGIRRKTGIQQQEKLLSDKLEQYQQQWDNALPSKALNAPMPGISQQAKDAALYVRTGGLSPQPTPTPAPNTHIFNSAAWASANPGKDVNAAIAQAKQQGYEVK